VDLFKDQPPPFMSPNTRALIGRVTKVVVRFVALFAGEYVESRKFTSFQAEFGSEEGESLYSSSKAPSPPPLPQTLLLPLQYVELSFSNFPPDAMWGALRESVEDIDQGVFDGVTMDGGCGDLLSLLAMLCAAVKKKKEESVDTLAALGAFSAVLSLKVDCFSSLTQSSTLYVPPAPASAVVSFCIEQIINYSSATPNCLGLATRTLSLMIRHSPPMRLAVTTTNNGIHRNLCRALLTLLTPSSPANQIISSLSVLPKLVVADELEEKIFDRSNVEKTLGLVFSKITSESCPYRVQMVAAAILSDLCSSSGVLRLVRRSDKLRPFLVEGWVTLVSAGEDLAKEASSGGSGTRKPLQPLINCVLALHRHCEAAAQTMFAVLVLRNNGNSVRSQGNKQSDNKYDINVEVATPAGSRSSNKGAESVVHALLQLSGDPHTPTAASASKLLKCILMASSLALEEDDQEARTEETRKQNEMLRGMVEVRGNGRWVLKRVVCTMSNSIFSSHAGCLRSPLVWERVEEERRRLRGDSSPP